MRGLLCSHWAKSQFGLNKLVGKDRSFAPFDQICDSFTNTLSIPQKFNAELVVSVPAYNGNLDREGRFNFRGFDVQREVASRSQGDVTLHSAACCRDVEERSFCGAVVGLDAGRIPHVPSWAIP
jgi:hypothetical protein